MVNIDRFVFFILINILLFKITMRFFMDTGSGSNNNFRNQSRYKSSGFRKNWSSGSYRKGNWNNYRNRGNNSSYSGGRSFKRGNYRRRY